VSRVLRRWVLGLAIAYLAVYAAVPAQRADALRVLVVAVVALVLWRARAALDAAPRPDPRWEPPARELGPPDERDVQLARLGMSVELAEQSEWLFDRSFRLVLTSLAEDRLRTRHGVVLSEEPERARTLMERELWQLLSTPPAARATGRPGPRPDELARLVQMVERI